MTTEDEDADARRPAARPDAVPRLLATVAPAWVRKVTQADDPEAAARTFFGEHPRPHTGPSHVIDGVPMVEVSFLDWAPDAAGPTSYLLLGGLQGRRLGDLSPFEMRPVGATPLRQVTYLLPGDGLYSYSISTPSKDELDAAEGRDRIGVLWGSRRLDERNPDRLVGGGSSYWQGPAFPDHPTAADPAPEPAADLEHLQVDHADGRRRDVWLARVDSGAARTVVLFDGDAWRELGFGARLWRSAGYGAHLVLMSSVERADRTADLTDPDRAASTLSDVLAAGGEQLGVTPRARDVVLVGG